MYDLDPTEDWGGGDDWQLVDPRPIKAIAPYTFFTPSEEELAQVQLGDVLQLGFAPGGLLDAAPDRAWLRLTIRDGDTWIGAPLPDQPVPDSLMQGGLLRFHPWHVWAVQICRVDDLDDEAQFLAGAHIDPRILTGEGEVTLLERRMPGEGVGPYPETGWYAYASEGTQDESLHRGPIGLLLNVDDSMMPLLRAPVGSRIARSAEGWQMLRAS